MRPTGARKATTITNVPAPPPYSNDKLSPLSVALLYLSLRWAVLPLYEVRDGQCRCGRPACPDAGKHPRVRHGVHDATHDPNVVRRWWTRWPTANVGIATGSVSDLLVLDIDPRSGGDQHLDALERQFGSLPETCRVLTGGGGMHHYFRLPCGLVVPPRVIARGVELKLNGGYVVAPPSVHLSGRVYAWEIGHEPW